jgi:VIT1/CCC1 family predicted Fe2+/Mn2+ transporter
MADDAAAALRFLQAETDSAFLYRALADLEEVPQLAELYRRLAAAEDRHAAYWAAQLERAGRPATVRPGGRARFKAWLARRLGIGFVLPSLVDLELADRGRYASDAGARAAGLARDEQSHARALQRLASGGGGVSGGVLARLEGRHRGVGGNSLRAAVLGFNDGLLSNFSLVMGVVGADLSSNAVLLTGFAGLLAGAGSMALGEWISVQSGREAQEHQLGIERAELAAHPEEERLELALILQARGLQPAEAEAAATRMLADEATALDVLAREELGIDPDELGGSPLQAAVASFLLFAVGAIVPVAPFLVLDGAAAAVTSAVASGAGLFAIGAAITLMTGRGVLVSGLRQLGFGAAAAAVTFAVGALLGTAVSG